MKPENKIPVLDKISDEMKSVVNFIATICHRGPLPMTLWPSANTTFMSGSCGMPMPRRCIPANA